MIQLCLIATLWSGGIAAEDIDGAAIRSAAAVQSVMSETGIPAMSLALGIDGEMVHAQAYGLAIMSCIIARLMPSQNIHGQTFQCPF